MENTWNDRIKNSEATPPENGWEKIAAALDESFDGHSFPVTLYNAQEIPPADTWNKIGNALEPEATPVVPIRKSTTIPAFVKYAAAACVIGLLAFGAIKLFGVPTGKVDTAANGVIQSQKNDTVIERQPTVQPSNTERDSDDAALEESKHTYAKLDVHDRRFASKISRSIYRSPAQLESGSFRNISLKNTEIQYPHRAAVNDSPADAATDRYMMFKNTDGQFVRISKKLTDLFCCVSGEEQDQNCTDQLKKWREKIASSAFVPSPDNFMDILDLVSSLQDIRN